MMLGEQRFRLMNAPQLMKAAFIGARSQQYVGLQNLEGVSA